MINWENYDLSEVRKIGKEFGEATVLEMQFNIANMDLVDKGILMDSISASPRSKQGFLDRIQFNYEFYGAFFEIGTGSLPTKKWRTEAIEK
ncbi:MAG: hypothetical protein MK066_11510, partial [Crocinitomicaceae bacterium]|nr:hypothetical protein [Crocinitomicaceae bacterium]